MKKAKLILTSWEKRQPKCKLCGSPISWHYFEYDRWRPHKFVGLRKDESDQYGYK